MKTILNLETLEQSLRLDSVEDYDGNIFALTEWGYQTIKRHPLFYPGSPFWPQGPNRVDVPSCPWWPDGASRGALT